MTTPDRPFIDTPCRANPDRWFLPSMYAQASAAEICMTKCGFREACLKAALDHEGGSTEAGRFGVWAGLTPRDRHLLARRRAHRNAKENTQ